MRVAIDFGASATKVAVLGTGAVPSLVRFGTDAEFPTAVYRRPRGGLEVGARAMAFAPGGVGALTTTLKRVINTPSVVAPVDRTVLLGGHEYPVVELVAAVLAHALGGARASPGAGGRDAGPLDLVLTHPVAWGEAERAVLAAAAAAAGVERTPRFVPEPDAAAAFVVAADLVSLPDGAVAVFDLGASTFDAAVVVDDGRGRPRTIASAGRLVGGSDVDVAILDDVVGPWSPGQAAALAELRDDAGHAWGLGREARRVKELLTGADAAVFAFQDLDDVEIERVDLDDVVEPLLDSCIAAFEQVLDALPPAVPIGTIVGTGGSVRMPFVREELARIARARDAKLVIPDEGSEPSAATGRTVALGAVHLGGREPELHHVRTDTAPVEAVELVAAGRDRWVYDARAAGSRRVASWTAAGATGAGLAGGEMAVLRRVAADPATGLVLTGTDNGCVELWESGEDGFVFRGEIAPTVLFGSFRGEGITRAAVRRDLAAVIKEEKPGSIWQRTAVGWRRSAELPVQRPEYIALLDRPRRLVVVDIPWIRSVTTSGATRGEVDWPGGYLAAAATAPAHGLLAASWAGHLTLHEIVEDGIRERFRVEAVPGPVGLLVVDGDQVLVVHRPTPTVLALVDVNGETVTGYEVDCPIDAVHTSGTDERLVLGCGSDLHNVLVSTD